MTYDAMGNVLTVTDARSDVSTYTYDALNRRGDFGLHRRRLGNLYL